MYIHIIGGDCRKRDMSLWQKVLPLNPGLKTSEFIFVLLQLHETVTAFIQYALMSS